MFWPITLLFAVVFSGLVVSGALDALSPVTQFAMTVCICTAAACIAVTRGFMHNGRMPVLPIVWACTAIILVGTYSFRNQGELLALSILQQPVEEQTQPASLRPEVMLMRAWDGHFRAVADIDDTAVGLLIDTGASLVLLRYDDARRIGLGDADLDFTRPVTTANGRSFVAPVTFDEIRIGGVVVRDVEGAVAQPNQLHTSLLGMSFIEQLSEASIRQDRIILRN
ncbi:TIGR02281 family clan AA aspartic protease [Roseobacter sp. HKCCA0434]|uniref:retropepsin-like aspartic protease family protein n=1 Tax=Roseobacter sp. HKCCA0434 TaxID=3079297 RepID=UPI002905A309|nr:TIGR02281 family clan AA aspartic protease [Roseobacter sp. HKCCA0434]